MTKSNFKLEIINLIATLLMILSCICPCQNSQKILIEQFNYRNLRWFINKTQGYSQQLKVSYFDFESKNQTLQIVHKLKYKTQIKALSPGLTCGLFYNHQNKKIEVLSFGNWSSFQKMNYTLDSNIIIIAQNNYAQLQISDSCKLIKVLTNVYHLNETKSTFERAIVPEHKFWRNLQFSGDFRFVVSDFGIYKFVNVNNQGKYVSCYSGYFYKNKKIWVQGYMLMIFSWQQSGEVFIKKYKVDVFNISMHNNYLTLISSINGSSYSSVLNNGPFIAISDSLRTVLVYGNKNSSSLFIKSVQLSDTNSTYTDLIINQSLINQDSRVVVQDDYIHIRNLVQSDKNKGYHGVYKIQNNTLVQAFVSELAENKQASWVKSILQKKENNSLSLVSVYIQLNKQILIERISLSNDNSTKVNDQNYTQSIFSLENFVYFILIVSLFIVGINKWININTIQKQRKLLQPKFKNPAKTEQNLIEQYSTILGLSYKTLEELKKQGNQKIRSNFKQLIYKYKSIKQKRIQIHEAYQYLNQKYCSMQYPPLQKQLTFAVVKQNEKQIIKILTQNKHLLNFRIKGAQYSLLLLAARTGNQKIVELLINLGCNINFQNDKSTPLHSAAYYGHTQVVQLLLQYGIPMTLKNVNNLTPIQQSQTKYIQGIFKWTQNDQIYRLIQTLIKQDLYLRTLNIKVNGQTKIKKIILKNYQKQFQKYQDVFHGTSFYKLISIAKHGLKKPGQIVQGKQVKIVDGHAKDEVWSNAVFVSPSVFYSGNSVYAKQHIRKKMISTDEIWLPLIQIKLKERSYTKNKSTITPSYKYKKYEPQQVEYRVQINSQTCKEKLQVIALILIQKDYLQNNGNYEQVMNTVLNSSQQKLFKQMLLQKVDQ